MLTLRAAVAAALLCAGSFESVLAAPALTLDAAFDRVITNHPDLATLRAQENIRLIDIDRAALAPARSIFVDAENLLGTDDVSGVHGAELTLSLASVFERREKRDARVAVASRHVEEIDLLRSARQLDLLAEVARRYLDASALAVLAEVARSELAQREHVLTTARARVRAGGSPNAVALAAEAAVRRAAAEVERTDQLARQSRRALAALWGSTDSDFVVTDGFNGELPALPDLDRLIGRLANAPELKRFAHESRLREARVQLARTEQRADINWQVGLRRLESLDDWAFVGSVSMPLGQSRRGAPDLRAAELALAATDSEHQGQQRALEATLVDAWHRMELAVTTAERIDRDILPALRAASDAAEAAFRAGASSQLEWSTQLAEVGAARREHLVATLDARRALIELQRLTGQSFRSESAVTSDGGTP